MRPIDRLFPTSARTPSKPVAVAPQPAAPTLNKQLGDMTMREFADLGETVLREALTEFDFTGRTREQLEQAGEKVIREQGFTISDFTTPEGRARHRAMVAQSLGARRRASYAGR